MTWRESDPCGQEADKVKYELVPYTRGIVLDLGCGPRKAFPHFLGIDSCVDTELFGIPIKPDLKVKDCADLSETVEDASVDGVFSSHLLEHIVDYKAALKDWWRCLKVGGHLSLYLPHRDFYPNIGTHGANPDHKSDFIPQDIIDAMHEAAPSWDLLVCEERNGGVEYSFLLVFQKLAGSVQTQSWRLPKTAKKTACICRFGGYGDMLQTANILPTLKEQGFHVTVMTTPKGQDILRHDPHVDAWWIQDKDQVPNHELNAYWDVVSKKFDTFINLCESVEGTLLAMPGRANHRWPDAVRHKHMDVNYLEFTAELAGISYESRAKFYPSKQEDKAARARLLTGGLNIVFALAGSSQHKFYPGQDAVIANILREHPQCRIFMVGDEACKILQMGWEKEKRVVFLSGELSIRDTLALAKVADVVVGCETGVLNAVAFEPNRKVVLLSHSSNENLTKHWENTFVMVPPATLGCYPCHRLHYTMEFCAEDPETGAAMCQRLIDPIDVYNAITYQPEEAIA